jgi:hypothetical protein
MLPRSAIDAKLQELPPIELSYETFPTHRKVLSPDYTIGIAIPRSKKYIAWFTFIEDEDVCLLLELNREKRVVSAKQIHVDFDRDGPHLAFGTFLYGSLSYVSDSDTTNPRAFFIIEDILMYRAVSLRKLCFGIRLGILERLLSDPACLPMDGQSDNNCKLLRLVFVLPLMFDASSPTCLSNSPYKIHHVQYRSLTKILPYMNVLDPTGCGTETIGTIPSDVTRPAYVNPSITDRCPLSTSRTFRPDSSSNNTTLCKTPDLKSGHRSYLKQRAVFLVTADVQSDIYHLVDPTLTYTTDVAYIPNYPTSVFMNSLFRNIKENRNLDAIEESDDEDDFYDMRMDKHVDLTKEIRMECVYHSKFRRWIPCKTM